MRFILFTALIFFFTDFAIISPVSNDIEAEILIRNIKSPKGVFVISLYDDAKAFPKVGKELLTEKIPVNDTLPHTVRIKVPKEGWYAIALFQDEDQSGKIKQDKVGIPHEPYAFSNNIHPRVEAPTFSACRFYVRKDDKGVMEIRLIQPAFHGKL